MESEEYDIVVIGAGMHALTFLSAFLEDSPMSSDLIDASKGIVRSKLSERNMRAIFNRRKTQSKSSIWKSRRIVVVDKHGGWILNWQRQFKFLGIESLRSNAGLHPDPTDPEMLFEFARMQGLSTTDAFVEITETKRGKDFVGPFQRPKTDFFNKFCEALIDNYKLKEAVLQDEVVSVIPPSASSSPRSFQLKLSSGKILTSKVVVCAIGHSNLRNYPPWVDLDHCPPDSILHAWDLVHKQYKEGCLTGQRVAVVGGGLTAVQLVNQAVLLGAELVYIISRRALRLRQFDSDLSWSGHLRYQKLAAFWKEPDFSRRFSLIKQARNGGTITAYALEELRNHEASSSCVLLEETEVWDVEWEPQQEHFTVVLSNEEEITAHKIWLATGSLVDIHQEQLFQSCFAEYELKSFAGYPILDYNLRWNPELDLFFMGAYASLAIGPDGVNLAGARRAAFRIKETLKQSLHFTNS